LCLGPFFILGAVVLQGAVVRQGRCPIGAVVRQGRCPTGAVVRQGRCPTGAVVGQGRCPTGAVVRQGRCSTGAVVRQGRCPAKGRCPKKAVLRYPQKISLDMLNTYRTMPSFYAKIKYFSLDSTFNIDKMRPVKRTSLYFENWKKIRINLQQRNLHFQYFVGTSLV
jgi:hypothetical protein